MEAISPPHPRIPRRAVLLALALAAAPARGLAQEPPRPGAPRLEARGELGFAAFPDDGGIYPHPVTGGALRIRVADRLAVEPEYVVMHGGDHRDHFLMLNLLADLAGGEEARPYLRVGVGSVGQEGPADGATVNAGVGIRMLSPGSGRISLEARTGMAVFGGLSLGFGLPLR